MRWCVYDPLLSEAQQFSTQISFGDNTRLIPQFDQADVVLALDSDFLNCGEGDLASIRGFTSRRRVRDSEGLDEPALRRRESLHPHRRDGRSSAALPGQPDPGVHACAGRARSPLATKDAGLSSVSSTLTARRRGREQFDDRWLTEAC